MIVPMKKVSLIIPGDKKTEALRILRKAGIIHMEIAEGSGEKLAALKDKLSLIETALFALGKQKSSDIRNVSCDEALDIAKKITSVIEEKKVYQAELISLTQDLDRLKKLSEINPRTLCELSVKGVEVLLYEMPKQEYENLDDTLKVIKLSANKNSVLFALFRLKADGDNICLPHESYSISLPDLPADEIREKILYIENTIKTKDEEISSCACYGKSLTDAAAALKKEIEFETYATGMTNESLSDDDTKDVSVSYFTGYIEADNLDNLKKTASENSWALIADDPSTEDSVPTKLKNNKFVSLIYPLTDFLGTVPGYFEYDISGWFLSFILIFFGIIFGDGGYGLLICSVAAIPIIKALSSKKAVSSAFLLIGLFGLSTVIWGTLTCTWFGLPPEQLPSWLKGLSIPVFSNVYADKLWHPFGTKGDVGLTTAQNIQIFCFMLALIQLVVAHIKVASRNRKSLRIFGDIGSILQLVGMYYLVLSLVVNPQVFSFSLKIAGIPVGTVAVVFIGVGFALSFVFANYEGSVIKSVLSSLTNIVSVLLGVVNVFSDIVSYIRLWAVGLAGAAISATVNELAGPLFGNFLFMLLAIFILVFGHGLNMILNVLSVVVHGIRLNTLEFSTHLDMAWSGHKFEPFNEKI